MQPWWAEESKTFKNLNDPDLLNSKVSLDQNPICFWPVGFTQINEDVNYAVIQIYACRLLKNIHINMFNFKGTRKGAKN